ncbi:MAG: ComEC/Rec2 family competence protein [Phycisphaerales bacterium]|nr:ComEC/Rec2 family competence protein [Phycisphaerales bacterium]
MVRTTESPVPLVVPLTLSFIVGSAIGRLPVHWWCWFIAVVILGNWIIWWLPRNSFWLTLAGVMIIGAGWSGLHRQSVDHEDLILVCGHATDPILVHLEGVVSSSAGSRIQLDVIRWLTTQEAIPANGRVVIRLPGLPSQKLIGRTVHVKGWLKPISSPVHGEPDWLSLALDGDYRGWMELDSWDLLKVRGQPLQAAVSWRHQLQSWASHSILARPVPRSGAARSLLSALLLGQRDHQWNEVAEPFRRLGVAHLLAISGMHLGMLAGMTLVVIRIHSGPRRWHGWLVLVMICFYLAIVELRPPIIRAGLMTSMACLGLLNHRRFKGIGLLCMAAFLVLLFQPGQIARPGFQLSFGVVAGLILLVPRVRRRWFGPRSWSASSPREVLTQWFMDGFAASVTAWLISVPLVIGHFGQFSLLAVPLSLVLMPVVGLILALGALRACLGFIPGVTDLFGQILSTSAEFTIGFVRAVDQLPFTSIEQLEAGWAWVVFAMIWVISWCMAERYRFLHLPTLLFLVGWLLLKQAT